LTQKNDLSLSLSLSSEKPYKLATLRVLENPEPTNQAQLDNVQRESDSKPSDHGDDKGVATCTKTQHCPHMRNSLDDIMAR
jgi:hypothetical protein